MPEPAPFTEAERQFPPLRELRAWLEERERSILAALAQEQSNEIFDEARKTAKLRARLALVREMLAVFWTSPDNSSDAEGEAALPPSQDID